jgi:hypothetical protein
VVELREIPPETDAEEPLGRFGTRRRQTPEDEIPPKSGTMNHTPTGWSAPHDDTPITIDSSADRSADRSRSDHGVKAGRPVACVAPKAGTAQRAILPEQHIIHSDAEHIQDDTAVSAADSDDDLIAAADYAIQQKELDMLRMRRDQIAKKASRSRKSKSSSGGDIDDIST